MPEPSTRHVVGLSERRREVLELLAKGLTNEEIGSVLHISGGTVRTHVSAILAALEVTNRTEAAGVYNATRADVADQVDVVLRRPSVGVVPIVALDRDPRSAVAAAAITEDLTSLLACWSWFPVISSAT